MRFRFARVRLFLASECRNEALLGHFAAIIAWTKMVSGSNLEPL